MIFHSAFSHILATAVAPLLYLPPPQTYLHPSYFFSQQISTEHKVIVFNVYDVNRICKYVTKKCKVPDFTILSDRCSICMGTQFNIVIHKVPNTISNFLYI